MCILLDEHFACKVLRAESYNCETFQAYIISTTHSRAKSYGESVWFTISWIVAIV
jgi:hypothetical protein